jgi:hypothetical protein
MKVGIIAITISSTAPRNFPFTICHKLNGFVVHSRVPCFFSSEKLRMVGAGIRKIKIHGAKVKKRGHIGNPVFRIL